MKAGCFIIPCLFFSGCMQRVYLKSPVTVSKIVIDGVEIKDVGPTGREVSLPIHFGPAPYSIFEDRNILIKGNLPRSQISPWIFGASVGSSMILSPSLAVGGALLVNPSWMYASSVFAHGGGNGAFWAYFAQTGSFWTLPAMLLGALIGALPLLGLLYSERFPEVVLLSHPNQFRN